MKTWKKIAIGVGVVVVLATIVGFTVHQSGKNVVTVQTGKVQRQDLSSVVSASGEIKPKTYVNIGANAYGKITHLYVKEGDHVKKGQLLAQLENVQSSADVSANQASVQAAETDAIAADAALNTSDADLLRAQADYERNKLDWDRAQNLFKDGLIAKSDFDSRQNAWATADSGLVQAKARVAQAKAQKDSADHHVAQARAISPGSPMCCRKPLMPLPTTESSPTCRCVKASRWSSAFRMRWAARCLRSPTCR